MQAAMYTTREVAALTGLHEDTVRLAAERGELPAPQRVGGKLLFSRAAIDAFVSGAPVPAVGSSAVRTAALR